MHKLIHFIFVCDRRTLTLQHPTTARAGYRPYASRAAPGSAHAATRGQGRLEVPALPHAGHPHLMRSVTHTDTDRQTVTWTLLFSLEPSSSSICDIIYSVFFFFPSIFRLSLSPLVPLSPSSLPTRIANHHTLSNSL